MAYNEHCYITNFDEDTDRHLLKKEFGKFGEIRKVFVENQGKFAKVYFYQSESCHSAANYLKKNLLGWKVIVGVDKHNLNSKEPSEDNSTMYEGYSDVLALSSDYVNVFGDPISLFVDENDESYVNLNDIKLSGFTIFKRSDFDRLKRFRDEERNNIIMKEFNLFMLSQASNYLLENVVTCINDQDIMETINRCKNLLGIESQDLEPRNRRSVNRSFGNNISVRMDNQDSRQRIGHQNVHNSRQPIIFDASQDSFSSHNRNARGSFENNSFAEPSMRPPKNLPYNASGASENNSFAEPPMRSPKSLPYNFGPTHTQRFTGLQNGRNQRDNRSDDRSRSNSRRNQRDRRSDNYERSKSNSRRQADKTEEFRDTQADKSEEFWDSKSNEQTQTPKQQETQRDSIASMSNAKSEKKNSSNKNMDARSQSSDSLSSSKKESFLKRLESVDEIAKVSLETGKTYNARVTHVEQDKDNICWVQKVESSKDMGDLLCALADAASDIETLNDVTRGQLALAEFEETWCRCRVIHTNPLEVIFIDFGNREEVESVKELPQRFRKMPASGIRIVADKNGKVTLKNDMDLKMTIVQKYQDETYLVNINHDSSLEIKEKGEVPAKLQIPVKESKEIIEERVKATIEPPRQQEEHYFDVPGPMMDIKNGDKVMLIDLVDNKFVVKTKECAQKSKEILDYIKNLNKSDLMLSSVKEGQLVLCSKDGLPNLCRGVVKSKVSPSIVTVKYLDYSGEDQLSVKSLRNVDYYLATEHCSLLFTPEMLDISSFTEKSMNFIGNLLEKKEKVKVVITEDGDFDLQMEGGKFLSQQLLILEHSEDEEKTPILQNSSSPKPSKAETEIPTTIKKEEPVLKNAVPISYDDMPYIKAEIGSTDSYLCYNFADLTEVTLISMTEESISYLKIVSDLDIQDEVMFEPELMDMCMVSYKAPEEKEPTWYRAVLLEKKAQGYVISMVDFGTQVTVPNKDIRRFPPNLKDIPMLGILCSLKNIPHNQKTLERVKELLPEGEEVQVVIKEFVEEDLKYLIEIPEIYDKLKKEGLL